MALSSPGTVGRWPILRRGDRWQRHVGRTGNRLLVESGRLEWWLAGSEQFSAITVLPEPPGVALPALAQPAQWGSVAAFAARCGLVDARCASAYPLGAVPPGSAGAAVERAGNAKSPTCVTAGIS